jgi:hypothetical protein
MLILLLAVLEVKSIVSVTVVVPTPVTLTPALWGWEEMVML